MSGSRRKACCALLALDLTGDGRAHLVPISVNHCLLFFVWRFSHSFITEMVLVRTVLGMRYVVMKNILLSGLVLMEPPVFWLKCP